MEKFIGKMKALVKDEEGASAVEYGVLVAGIIAVCVGIIFAIGGQVNDAFTTVDTALTTEAAAQ